MMPEIRLAGLFGLSGLICYLGYLFYDKDKLVSYSLLLIGIVLAILIIAYEISFKKRRHEAPWLFDNYKGE